MEKVRTIVGIYISDRERKREKWEPIFPWKRANLFRIGREKNNNCLVLFTSVKYQNIGKIGGNFEIL